MRKIIFGLVLLGLGVFFSIVFIMSEEGFEGFVYWLWWAFPFLLIGLGIIWLGESEEREEKKTEEERRELKKKVDNLEKELNSESEKTCPNCGLKISGDTTYCPGCGEKIVIESTEPNE